MRTNTKIVVDTILGTPVVYALNFFARVLGFLLRRDHTLKRPYKRIVVSKYAGLGSIVQATPLLQSLRASFPDAEIVFVTTESHVNILKHVPGLNRTYTVSDKNIGAVLVSTLRLVYTLWKFRPELYIDLEFYSNYSSIVTTASMAMNRLGFYKKEKPYRKGVYNNLVPFSVVEPISRTYLQFARMVGCPVISEQLQLSRSPLNDSAWKSKVKVPWTGKYIILNPNASDLRIERRWPMENFVAIINLLRKERPGARIVLIGSKAEREYIDAIERAAGGHQDLWNSAGKMDLSDLIWLISEAELMLTNDTGPMHIAYALGVRTIALFGPCSPLQYGHSLNAVTLYKAVSCSPCVHKHLIPPCRGNNICMKQIGVEEVGVHLLEAL